VIAAGVALRRTDDFVTPPLLELQTAVYFAIDSPPLLAGTPKLTRNDPVALDADPGTALTPLGALGGVATRTT
jgi:hypothetical protein